MSAAPGTRAGTPAVLFDLDGTLIDTKSLYLEAYRVAVQPYIRDDLSREDIKALKPTSEVGFLRAVVAGSDFEACLEDFYRAYRSLHAERFHGVYPGVAAVLTALRDGGLPLGLVTGKSRRSWEITSGMVPELGPFGALVFDDDVRAPKPDPHGLELALERLGIGPDRAVYVGDSRSDMEAARAAGLSPMAALWSRDAEGRAEHVRRLEDQGAALLGRPEDLLPAIGL